MRKEFLMAVGLLAGVVVATPVVGAAEGATKASLKGIHCMICKMQVSQENAADYKGGKVYFGCAGCPSMFQKNTAKYAAKANAQLVATGQARQTACPIMGKPCKKEVTQEIAGAKVAFCCPRCKTALAKLKPDVQVAKVFGDKAFKKAFRVAKKAE